MGRKLIDLTGQKFGRLTVIKYMGLDKNHKSTWLCRCECGNEKIIRKSDLTSGNTKSCGCYIKEITSKRSKTHGLKKSPIYNIWQNMKKRCYNKNCKSYKDYGARGIKICDEWLNIINFHNWAITNGYKKGLSIERVDVNGNYEPSNCTWIPLEEQARNKRSNHLITCNGETHCIAEWAEILGIKRHKIEDRINKLKWSENKTIETLIKEKN